MRLPPLGNRHFAYLGAIPVVGIVHPACKAHKVSKTKSCNVAAQNRKWVIRGHARCFQLGIWSTVYRILGDFVGSLW